MKKSKKLLSVILAIVMIFSTMSVMASAAKASYQTVDNLNDLNAYSPYGTVTRLDTETRLSIVCDSLDLLLAQANINMGTVVDTLGLTITINLTSINNVCGSLDSFKKTMNGFTWKLVSAIVNLGVLEELNLSTWDSGLNRENYDHTRIVQELLDLLSNNTALIESVLTNGIQLGLVANFIQGLDLSSINELVTNIPAAINGFVYPLFSRPDDTATERDVYAAKTQPLADTVNNFVNGLFTKPMNWTSYRVDVNGSDLGYTTALPTDNSSTRYFVFNADGSITQFDYQYSNDDKELIGTWTETVTYTMAKEYDSADCTTYVYKAPAGYTGDATLKWYKSDDFVTENGVKQSGYWLKDLKTALESGSVSINLNGSDSVVSLLYKFIPYVFKAMAPTVLNGSVKKLLAEAFDVEFNFIGDQGSEELAAAIADVNTASAGNFFTKEQDFYLWEYSDYKVIDGVPFYRFQNQYFKGIVPSNISTYYSMFNWDYKISGDFVNEFIPGADGSASKAGYATILEGLNKFVYKVLDTVLVDSFQLKDGTTYNLRAEMDWQDGGNNLALDNLLRSARAVFRIAPQEMFDEYYNDPNFSPYYNMMMNGTLKQAVTGLLCAVVEMLVPQVILPKEDKLCKTVGTDSNEDVPFVAVGVVLLREICTQLMPSYDFDALIYTTDGYNTKTLLTGADYGVDYWLDTALLMGVDLGMYYLRNLADLGEDDKTNGYFGVMKNLGAAPTDNADARTYAAGATYIGNVPNWQYKVDWIVDWALTSDVLWGWNMGKLVDCGSTVSLTTYENPWNKLDSVLLNLLPFDQLLNDSDATSTSGTFLENVLRDKFVGAILNLDLPKLASTFHVPNGYFRNTNILDQAVLLVRDLLNNVLYKVAGNQKIVPDAINSIGTLINQNNIKTIAVNLVGALDDAGKNGLLVTALPILNMFVGWTTDPQKYAEPAIYVFSDWNDNYLNSGCNNNLMFINTSSGMLLKHRNSTTVDHPYDIEVKSVTTDVADCTVDGWPTTVSPGETAPLKINLPANDCVVKFDVKYSYVGKDGQALGGEKVKSLYRYVSHTDDQENVTVGAADTGDYAQREAYKTYNFTENLYFDVTNYGGVMSYKAATFQFGNKTKNFVSCGVLDSAFDSRAAQYFQPITDRAEAGWLTKLEKDNSDYASTTGLLYKAKAGVTEETFNEKNAVANNLYGVYNMGQVATKYGDRSGTWAVQFIFYNDFNIGSVMDKYQNMNLQASDFTAAGASAFATYENALKEVVKWATYPKRTDYCDTVQPNIPNAITALDEAYTALQEYKKANSVANDNTIDVVKDALAAVETDPTRDLNFQDHALFEYFQYEKQRTNARNMIKACTPPAAPQKYISGEGVSAAVIDAIVANAATANEGLGITATVTEPTAEEMTNWNIAYSNFVAPNYTDLEIEDQAAKITYYAQFMTANAKVADHTFLDREIAAAQAQGYVEADYSIDSWSAYKTALDNAIAVNSDTNSLESRIFDAKYELMKAQNNLIPANASMKQDGYLDAELKGLIANAETILNHFDEYYKIKEGVAANDAWAQLVKALGVRYNVTVDGAEYSGILYNHSAYTFVDYDRLNTTKEKIKVDRACEKLSAALKNFVSNIVVETKENDEVITNVDQNEMFIQGIAPGSLATSDNVLAHIAASNPAATLVVSASANGGYGTGAKVDVQVTIDGTAKTLATYNVLVHGDVNGDSAIDAFDMFAVDKNDTSVETLLGIYKTAGDINGDGVVDNIDYASIRNETVTAGTISQIG